MNILTNFPLGMPPLGNLVEILGKSWGILCEILGKGWRRKCKRLTILPISKYGLIWFLFLFSFLKSFHGAISPSLMVLFTSPWKGGCQWDEDVHGECKHGIAQLWKPQRLPVCTHCSSCWGVCSKQPGASLHLVIVVLEIRGKRNSRITHIIICLQRICEN